MARRGHFVKKAITAEVKREIALRHGCAVGETVGACCTYCGAEGSITWFEQPRGKGWVAFQGLEMDHVIAEIAGGETSSSNLVLACVHCNRGKGKKSIDEFRRVM